MSDALLGKAVSIRALRKSYGTQPVLHGLDLEVAAGEFCTLLGASGSGKTTMLKVIAGFEDVNSGQIAIAGRDIARVPVAKRNIGMVFQNYALFPHMNVRKNVSFGLEMRGLDQVEIKRRTGAVLELVELSEFAGRLPGALSGGQQQRVALARALVINPDILLMDEPLGALDKNLRQSIQLQLKALHRELGVTILYVTHDQEEALHLSDQIVVMDKGRIAQHGSPQELYYRPASPFVAGFLGECNFLGEGAGTWAVRPEKLQPGTASAGQRQVDAVIEDVIFLGAATKVVARSEGRQITSVVNPTATQRPLRIGENISFYANEADVLVW